MLVGLQPRLRSVGQFVNRGSSRSSVHVMRWTQVARLPQPSTAVYVSTRTCVQPVTWSGLATQVTVACPQLSLAVTFGSQPGMTAGLQSRVSSCGQLSNVGGVVSTNRMCC